MELNMILQQEHQTVSNTLEALKKRYQDFGKLNLQLDMTRGKPSFEQLSLSDSILDNLSLSDVTKEMDYRNYSGVDLLTGIAEMKQLFADVLNTKASDIIIGGNSSLSLMYDTIIKALVHPLPEQSQCWSNQGKIKFLCPVPGYDRHFSICESFGIEMINIPLTGHGPDMDVVERLVARDAQIKGIWCVPQYSNPTGETYSDQTVERLAKMTTAASDFRIFWDNAYAVHHLDMDNRACVMNILDACREARNDDRVFMYASTSKVTYAGAGVAAIATSPLNIDWYKKHLSKQTIGYDKINQLRHLKLLPNKHALFEHMAKHAALLKPKFDCVDAVLSKELGTDGKFGRWHKPRGGYFISFNTPENLARQVVDMALAVGVKFTAAGATFPYGQDPNNCNIRIAPSLPALDQIKQATEVLAVVTKIATLSST